MAPSVLKYSILTLMISLSFWSSAMAQSTGIGTINDPPYLPSACYGYEDKGVMIAAASEALWNDGGACGKTYNVICLGATNEGDPHPCIDGSSVNVMITDLCPSPGCKGVLDLSHESFSTIANPDAGGIKISYQQV